MIRRHPHVFAGTKINSIDEVKENWEKIKKNESKNETPSIYTFNKSILDTTSLLSANKIGEKTKKIDFDWDSYKEVILKVKEELNELEVEIKSENRKSKVSEEYGDLLFSCVQLGRHLEINPESALRSANQKFIQRFKLMEDLAHKNKQDFASLKRNKKEEMWNQVKEKVNRLYDIKVPVIGITGGIATGKSSFSSFILKVMNKFYVDKIIKKIYALPETESSLKASNLVL